MRRYMWPNSSLPSATALITAAQSASEGRFTLEGVENHAARSLTSHSTLQRDNLSKHLPYRLSPSTTRMGSQV